MFPGVGLIWQTMSAVFDNEKFTERDKKNFFEDSVIHYTSVENHCSPIYMDNHKL